MGNDGARVMVDKGHVSNTFADAWGVWHAEIEAASGNGEREVYGTSWATVRKRAAKAIESEINARQDTPCPPVKVDFLGMYRRADGSLLARFREK